MTQSNNEKDNEINSLKLEINKIKEMYKDEILLTKMQEIQISNFKNELKNL